MKRNSIYIMIFYLYAAYFPFKSYAIETTLVNTLGMKFVYIQPGTFKMGSPVSEKGRDRDEDQHQVRINRGFYIQTTEVTQGQWFQIMKYNPSAFKTCGGNCPVENISWNDCQEFLKKLNAEEGTNRYRLPTEAEWEYACRAGNNTAFSNGDIKFMQCEKEPNLDKMGWYCGNSGQTNPVSDKRPHPVAQKAPNAWGLYDMHGNVQEWVQDFCKWRDFWKGEVGVITDTYIDGLVDPLSTKGTHRVFRGGSWNQSAKYSRAANRSRYKPMVVRNNIGLRIVKSQ